MIHYEIMMIIGMALLDLYYQKSFVTNLKSGIPKLSNKKIDTFIQFFSKDILDLKEMLLQEREFNENFLYHFSSLTKYPLIKIKTENCERLVCPIPRLLFNRITNGIYYEICDEKIFGNAYGKSFQKYIGKVIKKSLLPSENFKVISEDEYYDGKKRKDTIDWIILDNKASLFTECKTKRIKFSSKIVLNDLDKLEEELVKMAEFISKVYRSIGDYYLNKYPNLKVDVNRKLYPIILTLEDWFLFGNKIIDKLNKIVLDKLKKDSLENYLRKIPYTICSADEFETMIQIISIVGIDNFMRDKVFNQKYKYWLLGSYASHIFKDEIREKGFLFEKEMKKELEKIKDQYY